MSRTAEPPSCDTRGNEGPPEAPTATMPLDTAAAQRPSLQSADGDAAATSSASSSSSSTPSPGQRCAADAIATIFSFLPFKELPVVLRVCRQWLAAATKGLARTETFHSHGRRAAVLSSGSPLCRHIRALYAGSDVKLATLRALAALPSLVILEVDLDAAELKQMLDQRTPEQALMELRSAFPPRLRELQLSISFSHSADVCQLLLDALPAMSALERFTLGTCGPRQIASSLSLEPLLQLPNLSSLTWNIGELGVAQLQTVKQMSSLRCLLANDCQWTMEQLVALCRPPHRLQQLEGVYLWQTICDQAVMAELLHLPGLQSLDPLSLSPLVFALLPRFPHLHSVSISHDVADAPGSAGRADLQPEDEAALLSALSACSALTRLTFGGRNVPESFGTRLLQAVPRLSTLWFQSCALPSLRVLRHAPLLEDLYLWSCSGVRPGHVFGLGSFAPQLQHIWLQKCPGLQLDETELQLLTPPGALGLPQLQEFDYEEAEEVVSDHEDDRDY